jgi:hypothetical protein
MNIYFLSLNLTIQKMVIAQVNFGVNTASILGIIYCLLAIVYVVFMVFWLVQRRSRVANSFLALYIIQVIFIPLSLFLCGFILIFQGWRLDPILLFQQLLSFLIIIFLSIKDILINAVYRNR